MQNNHTRSIVILIVLAVIIIGAAFLFGVPKNNQVQQPPEPQAQGIVGTTSAGVQIIIDNVVSGQGITLPYTVTGTIGGWFFEGSFPVFMKDANGTQIGVGLASSSQDWMTANPIPFSVTLPASVYTGPGTLVFTKDNPSGESQYDDSFVVPVVFQ